jgi:SulP family sulfate permease
VIGQVGSRPRALILDLEGVPAMDSTGLRALSHLVRVRHREGTTVVLANLQPQPKELVLRSALPGLLGAGGRLDLGVEEAIREALQPPG